MRRTMVGQYASNSPELGVVWWCAYNMITLKGVMGNTSTFVPSSRDVARGVEPTLLSIPRSLHVLRKESPRLGRPRY